LDNVINLRGGIIGWARQGYEIAAPRQAQAGGF
jgi:rhodanese-related sulfurtransferase